MTDNRLRGWGILDPHIHAYMAKHGVSEDDARKALWKQGGKFWLYFPFEYATSKAVCAAYAWIFIAWLYWHSKGEFIVPGLDMAVASSVLFGFIVGIGFLFQNVWEKGKGFMAITGHDDMHENGTWLAEQITNLVYTKHPIGMKARQIWGTIYLSAIGGFFIPFVVTLSFAVGDVPVALTLLACALTLTKGILYYLSGRVDIRYGVEGGEVTYGLLGYALPTYLILNADCFASVL